MHIIDRTKNPGGKSLENRQKFLRRANRQIRKEVEKGTLDSIHDVGKGKSIQIPSSGIQEPLFHIDRPELTSQILPGNKTFVVGDRIPKSKKGGAGSDAGEGDSTDAFRFILSKEEFENLFLEDLELPDLARRQIVEEGNDGFEHAGYTTAGSPANMALKRTMNESLKRRIALKRPKRSEIEELEAKIAECEDEEKKRELQHTLEVLKRRRQVIGFVDTFDVRYHAHAPRPKYVAQAVMFCLMDVSGSMSEDMKDLAKKFYALLYLFLRKRYKHVEVVFIRHTDKAQVVDEETFFNDPASGGTAVSAALIEMTRVVAAGFSPTEWNIYVAQASDGDNSRSDNSVVEEMLLSAVLPIVQYYAYIEVGKSSDNDSTIWELYQPLTKEWPLVTRKVTERSGIFPVFRELFKKKED